MRLPSPLSVNLRERVFAAVAATGLLPSRRSPLRGQRVERKPLGGALRHEGQRVTKPMGCDHSLQRIKPHAGLILAISQQEPRLFLRELDPDRLVFLDETAADTNLACRHGWAPCGERCRLAAPHGHDKTTSVTAVLRTRGLCATALLDGPTNGRRFRSDVTETLIPVLQPGDLVVMDDLPAHKIAGVQDAIEAAGARLMDLPSYSPDLHPIRGPPNRPVGWGPLSVSSQNLRRCCAARQLASSRISGRRSDRLSPASPRRSAATTAAQPDKKTIRPSRCDREQL
ncbi:hypothetical protein J2X36_001446 [Methylobacterium sp. BE186]|nr:hypothetical protein [Methylobacterium sp. BE186]